MTSGRIDKHGGLSSNYVKTMLIIIQSALDYAVEQEWCPKLKSQIAKPPVDQKNIVILNPSELDLLENGLSADSSLESIGIMLSLYTGLRIGEICALRWSDIDLENRVLHVRHTIARIKNTDPEDSAKTRLVIDKPKTKSSLRDIPITTKIFALLTSARATSISEYVISDQSTFLSHPELIETIAHILDVTPDSLLSPIPNTGMEIMQFLFWMEELPQIKQSDKLMKAWIDKKKEYSDGLITHDQYLDWKLKFIEM